MLIFIYICLLLSWMYAVLMLLYRVGWTRQSKDVVLPGFNPSTTVCVVIPARNEEANIGVCIESVLNQQYPKDLLEIIVVDDHSGDATADIILSYKNDGVRYISLKDVLRQQTDIVAYKKLALTTAIATSKAELIITTDADCNAGPEWIRNIVAKYEYDHPVMVVAPVDFTSDNSIVQVFQSLDFMSMQGITAATLQLKLGNMSNGANLAFSRIAFDAVNGYKGIDHIASGDDYLLMTKLSAAYPGRISYLNTKEAIVKTLPQPDWAGFFQQRIRWASKSGKYGDNKLTAILMLVYIFNLCLFSAGIICIFQPLPWLLPVLMLAIKITFEIFYLYPVAKFFNKTRQLLLFPLLQPLHILYIVSAGLLGFIGVYKWKGRRVK